MQNDASAEIMLIGHEGLSSIGIHPYINLIAYIN